MLFRTLTGEVILGGKGQTRVDWCGDASWDWGRFLMDLPGDRMLDERY